MEEDWEKVLGFDNYSVSNFGRVANDRTERILALYPNTHGTTMVGMMRGGVQCKRSVPLLVANAFLPRPEHPSFNTPIQLDGDRTNCHISNLMWRPHWFAYKYHQQFTQKRRGFLGPIYDLETGERFESGLDACMKYGLLDIEILLASQNRTYVWPTYQRFGVEPV